MIDEGDGAAEPCSGLAIIVGPGGVGCFEVSTRFDEVDSDVEPRTHRRWDEPGAHGDISWHPRDKPQAGRRQGKGRWTHAMVSSLSE